MSGLTPKFGDTPTSWVSPDGKLVNARNADENKQYYQMGYRTASTREVEKQERVNVYDNWLGAAATFGNGVIDGIPLLRSGITHLTGALEGPDAAQEAAQYQQDSADANPLAHLGGALIGGALSFKAGSEVLGLTGMAGQGLNLLQRTAQGVAVNTAIGAGYDVDRAAIAHAMDPGGEEKIWAHVAPNILTNAALGAAIPVASAGLKVLGEWGEGLANKQWQKAVTDSRAWANALQQGRATELGSALDEYSLYGKTPSQVRSAIKIPLEDATSKMNELKAQFAEVRYSAKDTGNMADTLGTILGESHPDRAQAAVQFLLEKGNSPNLAELHELRQQIGRGINFTSATEEVVAAQQPLVEAYKTVGDNIDRYFAKVSTDPTSAQTWTAANKAYAKLALLDNALVKDNEIPNLTDYLQGKKGPPWIVSFLGASLGAPWIGRVLSAFQGAQAMGTAFKEGAFAGPAKMLSKAFFNVSENMDKALQAGLAGGVAAVLPKKTDDFDMKASQVRHAVTDLGRTMGNTVATASNMGLPSDLAASMGLKAQSALNYLAANLPQNPSSMMGAGLPTSMNASEQQKRDWLETEHSIREPWHVLENPTIANLKVMKEFYPELLTQTQAAIHEQVSTSKYMPIGAQIWASKILGYPVSALMRPTAYQGLQAAKQMQQQQAQMQQQQNKGKPPQSTSSQPTPLEQSSSLNNQ